MVALDEGLTAHGEGEGIESRVVEEGIALGFCGVQNVSAITFHDT